VDVNNKTNILGCFVSSHMSLRESNVPTIDPEEAKGELFRSFIWGEKGISKRLKELKHADYGKDLVLILFKFYVNPIPYLRNHLREIERYRRNERSIGVPIIVNNDNFFSRIEAERMNFLKHAILQKFDLFKGVVKRNKLDTNIEQLRHDTEALFNDF
jgi:hypothetical protein